jgi:hypothetical protein
MVIIDEHDIGKTKYQLLTDLIYESTGQRIPLNSIEYGHPSELDARPDVLTDPNTFIPIKVSGVYDVRLFGPHRGFMYRRRSLFDHLSGVDLDIEFTDWPTTLHQVILDQINPQLRYPLRAEDFVDYQITDEDTNNIVIRAAEHSLFWCGSADVAIPPPNSSNFILVENRFLDGFNVWSA